MHVTFPGESAWFFEILRGKRAWHNYSQMAKYFRVNDNNFMAPCSLLSRNSSGDLICNMLTALTVEA